MGLQIPRMLVQISDMPIGQCWPTPDEYAKLIAARLIVTPPQDFSTFVYGAIAPTSDKGPWFNTTLNEWWVWSQTAGQYVSERPSSITGEVPVGTEVYWPGAIADIPAYFGPRWMWEDGSAISRTEFSLLFAILGTKYGPGDNLTTFNIPDSRDFFFANASEDAAGLPATKVGDGVTPITSRGYTDHKHRWFNVTPPNENCDASPGGNAMTTTGALDMASTMAIDTPTRALPPFKSRAVVIRVK